MKGLFILIIVLLSACEGVRVGDTANSNGSNNTANVESNNEDSFNAEDAAGSCSDCEDTEYLESNYDVESLLNCTDRCGLEDGEDTPEKEQCDRDCIEERLGIAEEVCKQESGCE